MLAGTQGQFTAVGDDQSIYVSMVLDSENLRLTEIKIIQISILLTRAELPFNHYYFKCQSGNQNNPKLLKRNYG